MKKVKRRTYCLFLLIAAIGLGTLVYIVRYITKGADWVTFPANQNVYTNGMLTAGTVYDRNGLLLASASGAEKSYADDRTVRLATLHVTGDYAGSIGTGALSVFADKLLGYNLLTGVYSFGGKGNSVYLTIDAALNAVAYDALAGRNGTVAVYNYKTGEILVNVSAPAYDPADKPEISDDDPSYEGVYLNRFLSSTYTPGSVFKLVSAVAAIETLPDAYDRTYICTGRGIVGGGTVTCTGTHGEIALDEALAESCNLYFAQLSLDLGGTVLARYAREMGLTTSQRIDGIATAAGNFTVAEPGTVALAWSGIGQYEDLVNPAAMLTLMGAVANGGTPAAPRFLLKVTSGLGLATGASKTTGEQLLNPDTADALKSLMRGNVRYGYGDAAFPGLTVCAKTGTAEVGDGGAPHAWIVGFLDDEAYPLAFVVVAEHGGSGLSVAGKIANTVLQAAVNS